MRKLDYVDSLRGLAILSVLMVHVSQYGRFSLPNVAKNITSNGAMGVQLFYVASAFTLFLSFKNRLKKEVSPIRNFFLRRFFRIAPMYYLGICYYLIQDGFGPRYWLGSAKGISTLNVISNFTFLHGFNPYWINSLVPGGWSIGVEMMFYAALPFLYSRVKNINQAFAVFLGSVVVCDLLRLILYRIPFFKTEYLWDSYFSFFFPNQFPVFCLGIVMYFIIVEKELKLISGKLLLLFSFLLLAQYATGIQGFLPTHILFGISFLVLGVGISRYQFPILVNPVITYIGKISFSMYLVHFGVLHWMAKLGWVDYVSNIFLNYAIRYVLTAAFTIAISSVFNQLVEIPFQKLGKNIIDRLEGKRTVSSAPLSN